MRTNHRLGAALAAPGPRLIAAAAILAAIAATVFVLHPPALHAAGSTGATVSTAKTSLGRVLVNSSGRTLYLFGKDET
jgi:hypothetical protein